MRSAIIHIILVWTVTLIITPPPSSACSDSLNTSSVSNNPLVLDNIELSQNVEAFKSNADSYHVICENVSLKDKQQVFVE